MKIKEYFNEKALSRAKIQKVRYENFGGIISLENPSTLIYVDKNFMRNLGYKYSPFWKEKPKNYISAPEQVQFSLINKCSFRCRGCYANSGKKTEDELTTEECKKVLKILAKKKVFNIAFGGGEPFERKDLFELAKYCRKLGMIPNITTSGYYITQNIAEKCKVFGVIHVSLDGVGKKYKEIRGIDGFKIADQAIKNLVKARNRVGINCVVCSKNFEHLPKIIKYGEDQKVESILFLRFKPIGRGGKIYEEMKLSSKQNRKFFPLFKNLQKKTKIMLRIDCSFVPMVCYHKPPFDVLKFWGVEGCPAANLVLGILPNGQFNACSFCKDTGGKVTNLFQEWKNSNNKHFQKFRSWVKRAKPPCNSCSYLNICRGGCHIVAEYITGDFFSPDPECPWVNNYYRQLD
jgi:radical SAM protein with 4Fe4S-binding SPASM domain